jgi:hypothetical protein
LVWGQVGNTFHEEPVKPFLQPYSPANNYQSLHTSQKPTNNNTNKQHKIGKTPNKVKITITKISITYSLKQHQISIIQSASPEIGAAGIKVSFQKYNQCGSHDSGSFLDGYLSKSLHEKKIITNIAEDDNPTAKPILKKKQDSFIK